MRVIARKALVQFWDRHPNAKEPLKAWYSVSRKTDFENFAQLKQAFRSIDKVGKFIAFDIGGNKFRLITVIHFNRRTIYIRAVLTHEEYDQDHWKRE